MKIESAVFEMSAALPNQLPPSTMPEIVFSGRSNVGKSSLINRLLNRKSLARVSSTPGKTATVNFYKLDTMRLVDLPGYGYARISDTEKRRWAELIEGYFEDDRDLRLVVQLLDMRHTPSEDDFHMLDYLTQQEIPFILVLTKADKLKKTAREHRLQSFKQELSDFINVKLLPFSSESGEGVGELREILDSVTQDN
ncbi:MAG: YihA family ribosome biogenesis GTP-binding protein [Clostridiales bacterium]|jgi:GTP-binding protein|nr:YihA family ribosome biogenesis GTP-binding protein [Clostridiales bacterium]